MKSRSGMSLLIVATKQDPGTALVVSGRLVGPWIAELEKAFERAATEGGLITVDISDVTFVSSDGVLALRGFLARRARLRGCPQYLMAQLDVEGSS